VVKVKVKVNVELYIAPRLEHTSKALRYGTHSQGISQFYLHTPHLSANGMNHTCLCLRKMCDIFLIKYSVFWLCCFFSGDVRTVTLTPPGSVMLHYVSAGFAVLFAVLCIVIIIVCSVLLLRCRRNG